MRRAGFFVILLFAGLGWTAGASAANYTLADGALRFSVPDAWSAIMEKTEGTPQFRVFQVPNPQAPETLFRVSVTTRHMRAVTDFRAFVEQSQNAVRQGEGFSNLGAPVAGEHGLHYRFDEDGKVQAVHAGWFQHGLWAIELRCQRPRDARASAAWLQAWRAACADLARQLEG